MNCLGPAMAILQVEGCGKDIRQEKDYYQRYRICEEHLKLGSLLKDGVPQRFCQQCGRFHLVSEFDGDKRCAPITSGTFQMPPMLCSIRVLMVLLCLSRRGLCAV